MKVSIPLAIVSLAISASSFATGYLEVPQNNGTETGITAISGWHCTARVIQIRIDNLAPLTAGSGTERTDTLGVCGRTDTGFSLLVNYSSLSQGPHTVVAIADGVSFGYASIRVVNFGTEFLTGVAGSRNVHNFPSIGQSATIAWQEEKQNFSIVQIYSTDPAGPSPMSGPYYGATGESCPTEIGGELSMGNERFAKFDVTLSPDNQLSVRIQYADGAVCTTAGDASLHNDGFVVASTPTNTCGFGGCCHSISVDGLRLKGELGVVPNSGCGVRVFYGARVGLH
jgi:hypothetical protein